MVDGCFDPLHIGHLKYFEEAFKVKYQLFCNIQNDHYIENHKKRPPILPEDQRAYLIQSLKKVTYSHICYTSTADILEKLKPKAYIKGMDWKNRNLPQKEVDVCKAHNIEILFLDTILDSSTNLSSKYFDRFNQIKNETII